KVYEAEVQKKPNSNPQDMAFISSLKNSTNEDGNTDWSYIADEEDHALVSDGETPIEFALMANNENKAGKDVVEMNSVFLAQSTVTASDFSRLRHASRFSKRLKGRLVGKIRKPRSPLKLVDEPSAEDVLVEEPAYNEEEANLQRTLELSLKEQAERTNGPARPVVIREPDSGRIQPLLYVQGKGKEKVVDEQAAHNLLTRLTPKNMIHVDQFIFQRRTPMLTKASGHAESPSLDAKLALTDCEMESDNIAFKIDTGDQDECQAGPNLGVQDEGQLDQTLVYKMKATLDQTLFFMKKQQEEEPGKTNAESEVQSMVSVPIHQDNSSVPLMTTLVIDLTTSQSGSSLPTSTATTSIITTSLPPPPQKSTANPTLVSKAVDEIVTDAVDWAMQAPLRARFSHLPTVDMKEILQQQMFKDKYYEDHEDHKLYNALKNSLERDYSDQLLSDLEEACQKKRKRRDLPRTPSGSPPPQPPPPPPLAGASGALQQGNKAPSSSKSAASAPQSMAWTTSDTRYESAGIPRTQELSLTDSLIQNDSIPDEQATALISAYETPAENSLLAKIEDMTNFLNWYCRQVNKTELTKADLEGQAYEVVKAFYLDVIHLQFQIEECHVTIQTQFLFNKDLEYLRYGSKGSSLTLLISKIKAASYHDFGLELLMPEQMWIDDVHASLSRRKEVRSNMRILSVIRIKAYSRYGYDYLSEIVLRRADLQEHMIAEKDFKNLYPSEFKDLKLLLLQGYEFKHDYTIIDSPRAVVFPVNNNEQKIMRFNEIYKFSDDTLTRILEALAYKVKEFKIKRLNPGMNTRFWTQNDVTRSKEFIATIERQLKTGRIYQNLECFVGGRVHDINYRIL
nr:hypothetical protein [Tanacetum cinerariifolium]